MTISNDVIHKEIDLIQDCIKRMASNSFYLKGWFIAVLGVGSSIAKDNTHDSFVCIAVMLITLALWWLDGFFLMQETLYRKKYEWVIQNRIVGNLDNIYDLNPYNKAMWKANVNVDCSVWSYMKSKTLIRLYPIGIVLPMLYLATSYYGWLWCIMLSLRCS